MKFRIILFSVLLSAPLVADAASAPRTLRELAAQIVDVLTYTTATLVLLGLVIYMWGIASNIFKLSEGEVGDAYKTYVFWGIIGLFVMVSIWGILRLLQASLFGGSQVGMLFLPLA
jgi:hypothetical protein